MLIDRLQSAVAIGNGARPNGRAAALTAAFVEDGDNSVLRGRIAEQAAEIRRLQQQATAQPLSVPTQRLQDLETRTREQADEIERLKSEVELARSAAAGETGVAVKESKSFLKSRVERLEAEIEREHKIVARLRAELAAANERAARQAAQFMEEMRRLSSRGHAAAQSRTSAQATTLARAATSRPNAIRPRPQAAEASVLIASPAGETTARARELQRSLEASFGPAPQTEVALPAVDAAHSQEASDADRRPRLLERLRTYEDA
jgi:hypothetical protein